MAKKIKRSKKLVRVLRRKWFKPALYTLAFSCVLYIAISNIVIQKKIVEKSTPKFLISRLSENFDETEFTHLLLTIQELRVVPHINEELQEFANKKYPAECSLLLEHYLNNMNWKPSAFLIRVNKLFKMHDAYDRIQRMDKTIEYLDTEIRQNRLPRELYSQVEVLTAERDNLKEKELPGNEYQFMEQYSGLIQQLQIIEKEEN